MDLNLENKSMDLNLDLKGFRGNVGKLSPLCNTLWTVIFNKVETVLPKLVLQSTQPFTNNHCSIWRYISLPHVTKSHDTS